MNNLDIVPDKEVKIQLPLERIFGFCKTIEKITRKLGCFLLFCLKQQIRKILYTQHYLAAIW